jgi:uncharacterized delta-60 repeat protein
MKRYKVLIAVGYFTACLIQAIGAELPGSIDLTFEPWLFTSRIDYLVGGPKILSAALAPDFKVYVGGHITDVRDETTYIEGNGVYRLNDDGSPDLSFTPPVFEWMESPHIDAHEMAVQQDGRVWAGYDGLTWRLRSDGTVELSEGDRTPVGSLDAVLVYPDGRFLQATRSVIERYFADLLKDPTFVSLQDDGGFWGRRKKLFLLANEKMLLVDISPDPTHGSGHAGTIRRLNPNGTFDPSFPAVYLNGSGGSGIFFITFDAAETPNGEVYISGNFDEVNDESRPYLFRIKPDGSVDTTFNVSTQLLAGIFQGPRDAFLPLALQQDGKLLAAGNFTNLIAQTNSTIIRLNIDGSLDSSFHIPTAAFPQPFNTSADISHILVQNNGKIVITGNFQEVDGYPRDGVARLYGDSAVPLRLTVIRVDLEGHPEIEVTGTGETVVVEASEDLGRHIWLPLATNSISSGSVTFTDATAAAFSRYYRARLQ